MKLVILTCLWVSTVWAALPGKKPIVGGTVARDGQFPWQVAIYYDTPEGTRFCGGALIVVNPLDYNWVLTAGQCTYNATAFTLQFGANSLVGDDDNRVTLGSTYSVTHPDYNPNTLENDIGVIRVDTPIKLSDYIQTIPLEHEGDLPADVKVQLSGWGATGDWDEANNDLIYVELTSISNSDCKAIYPNSDIVDTMLCARGATTEGVCRGDVGGPLVARDAYYGTILVGIASWASDQGCKTDHPSDGFTRTHPYVSWIVKSTTG